MNCCLKSGIQKVVPNRRVHVQIVHGIVWLFSIFLPDHGEVGFKIVRCVRRYVEIVLPCRFRIILTFLVNWRTGSVCNGVLPSFTVFGQQVLLCSSKFQPQDCQSLLNFLLLDATGRCSWGIHPWLALETSKLRRMSLVQHSSCCRVSPKLSASPEF